MNTIIKRKKVLSFIVLMMVATTSIGASSNDSNYECEKLAMDVHETLLKQGASHSSAYWWSEMIYDACEYTGPQMWEN